MPAVIFGNRFRGRGVPAWHGIGRVFENDPSAVEATKDADCDYQVFKTPIYADMPGKGRILIPDQYGVIRGETAGDEAKYIATVGKEFQPVQNIAIAEAIDASGLTKLYQVETVGALGDGETFFLALSDRDGEFDIAGSPARMYWTAYNGHDGNRALGLMQTPVKTVCSNTLVMALKAASINVKISHTDKAGMELDFWLGVAPAMRKAQEKAKEVIGAMARFEVNAEQVDAILEAAYPSPKAAGKAQLKNLVTIDLTAGQAEAVDKAVDANQRAALRQYAKLSLARDVFENYASSDGEKGQAGTAWGVYEAVCDVEDHREASRVTEDMGVSALIGPRARSKRDAFAKAMAVAGVKE